jgi:ABC-type nickel/cobalt efflux system permease component RcnA
MQNRVMTGLWHHSACYAPGTSGCPKTHAYDMELQCNRSVDVAVAIVCTLVVGTVGLLNTCVSALAVMMAASGANKVGVVKCSIDC